MKTLGETFELASLWPDAGSIPAALRVPRPLHQTRYLVGGKIRKWAGPVKPVFSPVALRRDGGLARPLELGSFPLLGAEQSLEALASAVAAYDHGRGPWPRMAVAERIERVELFTRLMLDKRQDIVRLIMWEIGKSLADCEKEFDRTVEYIRATIEALKDVENESSRFSIVEGTIGQIRRSPLGVVLCMGPYNYPLNETFTTLIPALIMGNTVLLKPPKLGVLCYYPLLDAFRTAFPAGVVNTVYGQGEEVVPPLMASGSINVLALIGSSRVADKLKKLHPKSNRLRAVLGLDAKNPAIILRDADIGLAVKECLLGTLSFNGQRCTALKMLLVHRSIADEFLREFMAALGQLKIGMPWEPGVQITPVAEDSRSSYLADCLADARRKGAKVLNAGGGEHHANLFRPAVVYPVKPGMRLYDEEQFGPVIPVMPFDDLDTVIEYIVESSYGQQISVFGRSPAQLGHLADVLVNQVCRVNLNCQCQRSPDAFPFTGRKDSAESTLSITDALRAFSIRTMVAAKQTDASKRLLNDIVDQRHSSFIHTGFVL